MTQTFSNVTLDPIAPSDPACAVVYSVRANVLDLTEFRHRHKVCSHKYQGQRDRLTESALCRLINRSFRSLTSADMYEPPAFPFGS